MTDSSTSQPPLNSNSWSRPPERTRSCAAIPAAAAPLPSTWSPPSAASTATPTTTGYLTLTNSPATTLAKPRRAPSPRSALTDHQLSQIIQIAETTGNDPELDALILRLHIETACRRAGALALRPKDIEQDHCLLWLREKDQSDRWQPISPTLAHALLNHADRGTDPEDQLLRYRNGKPITGRRYDHLWTRIGRHLPWVRTQQITAHWLRHTTLTWVERNFGYAIARAYAGHSGDTVNVGTTMTYVRATLSETASALSALTGEPHPLVSGVHTPEKWDSPEHGVSP
ncbi:tyrosine-type recombinase/integrase [Nocardia africana]|uniref:Tyrosine-type recombinase/integrase n=1 Tax=Nocardia africana TaxID=134964 RepID=A0ABW6NEA6_9NOCA